MGYVMITATMIPSRLVTKLELSIRSSLNRFYEIHDSLYKALFVFHKIRNHEIGYKGGCYNKVIT